MPRLEIPAMVRHPVRMGDSAKSIVWYSCTTSEAMVGTTLETPVGPLLVAATHAGVCTSRFVAAEVRFDGQKPRTPSVKRSPSAHISTGFGHAGNTLSSSKSSSGSATPQAAPSAHLELLGRRLAAYFDGLLAAFQLAADLSRCVDSLLTIDLSPWSPSAFQLAVWKGVARIPPGSRLTYGELARELGAPRAARAVGRALASNPLQLIIPCHRVVPAVGGVGGYAGGASVKQALLRHESRFLEPLK